jgi:hypothetical protein
VLRFQNGVGTTLRKQRAPRRASCASCGRRNRDMVEHRPSSPFPRKSHAKRPLRTSQPCQKTWQECRSWSWLDGRSSAYRSGSRRDGECYNLIAQFLRADRSNGGSILILFTVVATNRKTEMAIKPSIVLVHGFWGGAAHWAKVIVQLSKLGYESLGAVENPLTSLADDAERTGKMLAQQQGPVLLVGIPTVAR